MDRDELLKLLDLDGRAAPAGDDGPAVTPAAAGPPPSAHPTALDLDDWALRRGRELLAESGRLAALGLGEHAVADFHGAAAREEVAECRAASAAFGLGPGSPGANDAAAVAALFRRVRGSATLRRIV